MKNNMKNGAKSMAVLAILIVPTLAWTENAAQAFGKARVAHPQLPLDAQFVTQMHTATGYRYGSRAEACQAVSFELLAKRDQSFKEFDPWGNSLFQNSGDAQGQVRVQRWTDVVEFRCQEVYWVWTPFNADSDSDSFGHTAFAASGGVELYCRPRSLLQQEILTLERNCRKDPKPECYSKDFLDQLKQVQPLLTYEINRPNC